MCSLKEFLDNTDSVELQLYLENIIYSDKTERECTRMITYFNMLPNMKKGYKKSIQDIFPLPTDTDKIYELEEKFDQSDYENTKKKLDTIKESLNINSIFNKNISKKDE